MLADNKRKLREEIFVAYPVYYNQTRYNEVKYNEESTFTRCIMKVMVVFSMFVVLGVGGLILALSTNKMMASTDPLKPGVSAPLFALPDQNNAIHKLADSKGKIVVLAFYPADMTKGCSLEAHNLTAALVQFKKRNVVLYGISVQDVNSKKKFCETDGITYPLLADVKKDTSKDYGVLTAVGVARRTTFVIDKKGKIAAVDPSVSPTTVVPDTLKMVDEVIAKS
jgi:peroxiredoxin Q/BCP